MTFENKRLILKEFEYEITLRGLLKEENQVLNLNGKICFLIKTEDLLKFYRNYTVCINNEIGVVCESKKPCRAHAAQEYLNYLKDEIINNVENEKRFYKAFYFQLTDESSYGFGGWTAKPIQPKCLKHLSYSRCLAFIN